LSTIFGTKIFLINIFKKMLVLSTIFFNILQNVALFLKMLENIFLHFIRLLPAFFRNIPTILRNFGSSTIFCHHFQNVLIFLKVLDNIFLEKIQHFYSFFVNIFVKCCINFGTPFLPTFSEKNRRRRPRQRTGSSARPAAGARRARAELRRCLAPTAR
jgi:hypothetical protein